MKIQCAAALFAIGVAGCASQPLHSKTSSGQPTQANEPSTLSAASKTRVTLPYRFTRHGVDIRTNSIEFAGDKVLVSVTLQETRGQMADLLSSMLLQMFTAGGQPLSYSHYNRNEKTQTDPTIHLAPHDQFSVTLFFQSANGSSDVSGSALELRFPTGKYWSSQAAD